MNWQMYVLRRRAFTAGPERNPARNELIASVLWPGDTPALLAAGTAAALAWPVPLPPERVLALALAALPVADRHLLLRYYRDEMPSGQLCRQWRLTPGQFRQRLAWAKRRLDSALARIEGRSATQGA